MRSQARAVKTSERRVGQLGSPRSTLSKSRARGVGLLLLAVWALQGCSFAFVREPPPPDQVRGMSPVHCTSTPFWPIVDTVLALGQVGELASTSLRATDNSQSSASDPSWVWAPKVLLALAFATGAYVGFDRVGRCNAYLEAHMRRPPHLPPGVGPYRQARPDPGVPEGWQPPQGPAQPGDAPPDGQQPQPGLGDAPPPAEAYTPPTAPTPTADEGGPGVTR